MAHADIEDGKQTTTAHVTGISTTATDGLDGDKNVIADAETTITDDVAYENALTGIGYTMTGILMDAETGLPITRGRMQREVHDGDVAASCSSSSTCSDSPRRMRMRYRRHRGL